MICNLRVAFAQVIGDVHSESTAETGQFAVSGVQSESPILSCGGHADKLTAIEGQREN